VPAGKTLDITGVDVGVGASAVVTVNGTLHVGDGSAADVTLTKAVITAAANANAAIFDDNTTGGALNLAAGDKVELADGGSITIAGSGSVVAGATTFDGAGAWTASGAAVTVTGSANGATLSGTGATLTATGASPKITQAAGSGNELTIAAGVTLDTTAASIVLKSDASNAGTLVLTPKTDSNAADGGGAKLVINSSGANAGNASVAKSGQTATNLTATGTAADTLTFTGTANTVITNIPANDAAAAIKSLEAATTTAANATNGTITLEGYATNDVTVSAAAKFRYGV
jgi:hypothetical protein